MEWAVERKTWYFRSNFRLTVTKMATMIAAVSCFHRGLPPAFYLLSKFGMGEETSTNVPFGSLSNNLLCP